MERREDLVCYIAAVMLKQPGPELSDVRLGELVQLFRLGVILDDCGTVFVVGQRVLGDRLPAIPALALAYIQTFLNALRYGAYLGA
jgi:hypothetical protein